MRGHRLEGDKVKCLACDTANCQQGNMNMSAESMLRGGIRFMCRCCGRYSYVDLDEFDIDEGKVGVVRVQSNLDFERLLTLTPFVEFGGRSYKILHHAREWGNKVERVMVRQLDFKPTHENVYLTGQTMKSNYDMSRTLRIITSGSTTSVSGYFPVTTGTSYTLPTEWANTFSYRTTPVIQVDPAPIIVDPEP